MACPTHNPAANRCVLIQIKIRSSLAGYYDVLGSDLNLLDQAPLDRHALSRLIQNAEKFAAILRDIEKIQRDVLDDLKGTQRRA